MINLADFIKEFDEKMANMSDEEFRSYFPESLSSSYDDDFEQAFDEKLANMSDAEITQKLRKLKPARDSEGHCLCDWCVKYSPLFDKITTLLNDEDKKTFDEFLNQAMMDGEDAVYYKMKFEGTWPSS